MVAFLSSLIRFIEAHWQQNPHHLFPRRCQTFASKSGSQPCCAWPARCVAIDGRWPCGAGAFEVSRGGGEAVWRLRAGRRVSASRRVANFLMFSTSGRARQSSDERAVFFSQRHYAAIIDDRDETAAEARRQQTGGRRADLIRLRHPADQTIIAPPARVHAHLSPPEPPRSSAGSHR